MFENGIFPRDLSLVILLLGFSWLAWRRPWLGLLGLAVLGYMHPHGYTPGFMKTFPVYASLFSVVVVSTAYATLRGRLHALSPIWWRHDWRVYALPGLWLWFALTSHFAVAPWESWDKFHQVARILPPLLLTLFLIDERRKLHALTVVVALSIMLVAVKGGYWAVMSGFQDRVYGPPGSQYGDNNEFAVAVCMAIPLLVLWLREIHDRLACAFLLACIALCYGAVLSCWSRGGILALAAATLVLILHSRRKWLLIPALAALAVALFVQLPDGWFGRMQTLGNHAGDESAQSRLQVWRIGYEFTLKHPLTGGGFNVWPALTLGEGSLDWHSAYMEMASEHGLPGLALWGALLLGSVVQLAFAAWRPAAGQPAWVADYSAMLLAALLAYLVGAATLGIAYWELPYLLVVLSVLLRALARRETTLSDYFTHPATRAPQRA